MGWAGAMLTTGTGWSIGLALTPASFAIVLARGPLFTDGVVKFFPRGPFYSRSRPVVSPKRAATQLAGVPACAAGSPVLAWGTACSGAGSPALGQSGISQDRR
jgi:hypothetical protein